MAIRGHTDMKTSIMFSSFHQNTWIFWLLELFEIDSFTSTVTKNNPWSFDLIKSD